MPYSPPGYDDYLSSPLYDVYRFLFDVDIFVVRLFHAVEGKPVLGVLSDPLWGVHEKLYWIRHIWYDPEHFETDVLRTLVNAYHYVRYLLIQGGLREAVDTALARLNRLRDDPEGAIREWLVERFNVPSPFRYHTRWTIEYILSLYFPDTESILRDPANYVWWKLRFFVERTHQSVRDAAAIIYSWLVSYVPGLDDILHDPIRFLSSIPAVVGTWYGHFFTDFYAAIRDVICTQLQLPQDFIYEPWRYIWGRLIMYVRDNVEARRIIFREWGERILRWIWEDVW